MLSKQDNERLTRVGAGTPMGELLRRYCNWFQCQENSIEGYPFQAGQPGEVRKWYEQAMGVLRRLPDSPKSN